MPPASGYRPSSRPANPEDSPGPSATHTAPFTAGFALAGRFLLPFDRTAQADNPAWSRAGAWLPVWGAVIGVVYALVFSFAWLCLGEYQHVRLGPMVVLVALDVAWLGYRLVEGTATVVASWRAREHTSLVSIAPTVPVIVAIVLLILAKYTLLLCLPFGARTGAADWRQHLFFLYPAIIYRPLILMPLWGRWGVMLATTIGRSASYSHPRLKGLVDGSSLPSVLTYWLAICGLTVLYCSIDAEHMGWSILIGLGTLVVAYVASFALARRFGGQTEATLLTVGAVVEFTFLLIYLPMASAMYWY
jgi:hypothetical protein